MSELLDSGLPGLDLPAFRAWYDGQRLDEIAGPLRGRVIAGGKSNLTYEVTDGASWWIVRRPPLGHVQATAHDMGREYTAMTALAGTDVPVPETFAHCTDQTVLGAEFYVMQRMTGTPYRTKEQLAAIGPRRTDEIAAAMIDVLGRLHRVDPAEVGLADFGRPEGFLERQVRRWGRQLDGSRSRDLPDADRLLALLAERVGDAQASGQAPGIVHGDYRLDNLLVVAEDAGTPDGPVKAVVDWEMATVGDPLTDVALLLVYDSLAGLAGGDAVADAAVAEGYPDADTQLERYAAASGRDLGEMDFHLGLAHLKLAVICEGIHYRYQAGQTVGDGFAHIGAAVPPLLAAGLRSLNGPAPRDRETQERR